MYGSATCSPSSFSSLAHSLHLVVWGIISYGFSACFKPGGVHLSVNLNTLFRVYSMASTWVMEELSLVSHLEFLAFRLSYSYSIKKSEQCCMASEAEEEDT